MFALNVNDQQTAAKRAEDDSYCDKEFPFLIMGSQEKPTEEPDMFVTRILHRCGRHELGPLLKMWPS